MASLVLLKNPLAPHTREIHPLAAGTPVIDWLQAEAPYGFGMPVKFYVNGVEKPLDDLDYAVAHDDVAVIALMPGDPGTISLSAFLIQLAIGAILAGASIALNYFFQPSEKSGPKGDIVSVYDVSTDQNAAKIGDAIPVVYGTVITTPDYAAQPYAFYQWSQANFQQAYNGIQYLDMLLCIGQGNIDVSAVYLGDTMSNTPDVGVVTWRAFKPAEHGRTMGVVSAAMGGGFHENVISSPEVSNQEFVKQNDAAGFFATCKPGQKGSNFQIDIVFPGGQTNPTDGGNIRGRTTEFTVYWYELDDNDNIISGTSLRRVKATTENSTVATGPNLTNITTTSNSERNKTQIGAPIRRSYMFSPGYSARWAVKIIRNTDAPDATNGTDRFIWAGLKLYADYPVAAGSAYGNVTLLACRVKASQGLGTEAAVRLRVKATRRLVQPNGSSEAATTNPADAFADVYTNATYGANRPRAELDVAALQSLRSKWSGYEFNNVFRDRITVWEALRTITTPFAAEPLPVGPVMSAVQDGVKSTRSMLFTDANIVAGSMTISYSFDEEDATDGVEIEYLDPKDFRPVYTRFPTNSLRPDQYALPGCTNATHAAEYARLTWQRRQGQRKKITFDTELEGLILQLGDRIGVSHNVPKWGDGGQIVGVSGLVLTADHHLDWSGGAKQVLLRKIDGSVTSPINVTRGVTDNKIVLLSSPGITINADNDYDYTSFAFGSSTSLVRDFIVTSTKPTGENTVTVEAINYAPDIYSGAMGFLSS